MIPAAFKILASDRLEMMIVDEAGACVCRVPHAAAAHAPLLATAPRLLFALKAIMAQAGDGMTWPARVNLALDTINEAEASQHG
jgi:hypothetical protein